MLRKENAQYEAFIRVREFGKTHSALFANSSKSTKAFAQVADAAASIEAHVIAKPVAARSGRTARAAATAALRDAMVPIARTARGLTSLTPQAKDNLHMPRSIKRAVVVAAARTFLTEGEKARDELIELGLPPSCLDTLREATDRFEQAVTGRAMSLAGVAAAQEGITQAIDSGLAALRELDIVVPNLLAQHQDLLAGWRRGRRIVIGRRKTTPDTHTTTEAPATSAPPTAGDKVAETTEPLPKAS